MLPFLYVGSYFTLLEPDEIEFGTAYWRMPNYRLGGDAAATLFAPMNWLDQGIRPDYWHGNDIDFEMLLDQVM